VIIYRILAHYLFLVVEKPGRPAVYLQELGPAALVLCLLFLAPTFLDMYTALVGMSAALLFLHHVPVLIGLVMTHLDLMWHIVHHCPLYEGR
jgi:hypothetical protein